MLCSIKEIQFLVFCSVSPRKAIKHPGKLLKTRYKISKHNSKCVFNMTNIYDLIYMHMCIYICIYIYIIYIHMKYIYMKYIYIYISIYLYLYLSIYLSISIFPCNIVVDIHNFS